MLNSRLNTASPWTVIVPALAEPKPLLPATTLPAGLTLNSMLSVFAFLPTYRLSPM